MSEQQEELRRQLQDTAERLGKGLGELEEELGQNIEFVKKGVDEVVDAATSAARALSPTFQIQKRPFVALGVSVVAGFLVGRKLASSSRRQTRPVMKDINEAEVLPPIRSGLVRKFMKEFDAEIRLAKGVALGMVVRSLAKKISEENPSLAPHVSVLERLLSDHLLRRYH